MATIQPLPPDRYDMPNWFLCVVNEPQEKTSSTSFNKYVLEQGRYIIEARKMK